MLTDSGDATLRWSNQPGWPACAHEAVALQAAWAACGALGELRLPKGVGDVVDLWTNAPLLQGQGAAGKRLAPRPGWEPA